MNARLRRTQKVVQPVFICECQKAVLKPPQSRRSALALRWKPRAASGLRAVYRRFRAPAASTFPVHGHDGWVVLSHVYPSVFPVPFVRESGAEATAVQTLRVGLASETARSVWTARGLPPLSCVQGERECLISARPEPAHQKLFHKKRDGACVAVVVSSKVFATQQR